MSFLRTNTSRPESFRMQNERKDASGHIRFPDKPFPHTMLLVFEEYNYKNFASFKSPQTNRSQRIGDLDKLGISSTGRQSGVSLRSTSSIELPFPKQLQDSNSLIVNGFQRDPLTEGLTQRLNEFTKSGSATLGDIPGQLQAGGAALAKLTSSMGGGNVGAAIKGYLDAIGTTKTADVASASMYLLRKFLPDSIAKSVNLATGQVLNPRETLAFEGVQLRSHQFNWDLYPSNARDSKRIQEVINQFKKSVLPVTQDLGVAGIAEAFLRYPNICKIYLIGVDSEYYMKFKPAMVTNMTVDYAAGGNMGIMQGGRPAGVNISISLQELQIETANDYGAVSPSAASGLTEFVPPTAGEL